MQHSQLRECMDVLCTWVKLLTDLPIWGCELHKNAFGGLLSLLPLLSARPAVTLATLKRAATSFAVRARRCMQVPRRGVGLVRGPGDGEHEHVLHDSGRRRGRRAAGTDAVAGPSSAAAA